MKLCDFQSVYNGEWLTDTIIDHTFDYLFNKHFSENPYFCCLPTAVFSKLKCGIVDSLLECYFMDFQLSSITGIVLPCCVADNHWILVVAWTNDKIISVYDSIGGYISYVKEPMKLLGDYMSNAMAADREIFQFQNYRLVNELVPKQTNNNDCGVFMCSFAYSIAKYKRRKVVIESGVKNLRPWLSSFILHSINHSSDVNKAIQAIAEKELLSLQYSIISFNKDMINNEACTIDLVEEPNTADTSSEISSVFCHWMMLERCIVLDNGLLILLSTTSLISLSS